MQINPKLLNSKKLSHFLAIFALLALFLFGLYLLSQNLKTQKIFSQTQKEKQTPTPPSPTPNPISDWKTYVNHKFKYSVKYPNNFYINNYDQKENEEEVIEFSESGNNSKTNTVVIDVSSDQISKDLYSTYKNDVETKLQNNQSLEVESQEFKGKYSKLLVSNIDAYQLNIITPSGLFSNTLLEKNGQIFKIAILANDPNFVDQILSSFKFLE